MAARTTSLLSLSLLLCLLPLASSQCTALPDPANPSNYYDLSPLASPQDYVIPNTQYPAYFFHINVCRPIVQTDTRCDSTTSVCERSSSSSNRIGQVTSSFTYEAPGKLVMLMPGGNGCSSAKITFLCDPNAGVGAPVYVSENCEYSFTWSTSFACSKPVAPADPCLFSINGKQYDLTPLSGVYQVDQSNSAYVYTLNPCRPLFANETRCQTGVFGCQHLTTSATSFSIGSSFYGVEGEEGKVVASYGAGNKCTNGKEREFYISYVCGESLGQPTFVKEVDCTYFFEWETLLVCGTVKPTCKFSLGGKAYDFTSLDKTWAADGGIYTYLLNPCSTLQSSTLPTKCESSQVCQQYLATPTTGYSIGTLLTNIRAGLGAPNNTVTFFYEGGDYCPNWGTNRAAEIYFGCGTSTGKPTFVSEVNCLYRFNWMTNLAC